MTLGAACPLPLSTSGGGIATLGAANVAFLLYKIVLSRMTRALMYRVYPPAEITYFFPSESFSGTKLAF